VRVIAGTLGGRRLVAPRGARTRPTSDRVREALFMALEPLEGLRVVDLFAGSGALGIEALSRGAAHADFIEPDRAALAALRANLGSLGLEDRARVWPLRLPAGLRRIERPRWRPPTSSCWTLRTAARTRAGRWKRSADPARFARVRASCSSTTRRIRSPSRRGRWSERRCAAMVRRS
jgi:hypothetical protein